MHHTDKYSQHLACLAKWLSVWMRAQICSKLTKLRQLIPQKTPTFSIKDFLVNVTKFPENCDLQKPTDSVHQKLFWFLFLLLILNKLFPDKTETVVTCVIPQFHTKTVLKNLSAYKRWVIWDIEFHEVQSSSIHLVSFWKSL